jgi:hypothetical protein
MANEGINWREIHKKELTDFVRQFYQTSYLWRQNAYHEKWDKYERNYRSIYDPDIKKRKAPWQSCLFVPSSNQNVEVITSALTKIHSGKKHALSLEPREMGDELQAEMNTNLMGYYLEKGNFPIGRYDTIKESGIYGSGFMKIFWERKYAKRRIRKPVLAGFMDMLTKGAIPGTKLKDVEMVEDVLIKNGIRYQHVHIRDIFLEPNSKDGARVIHRDKITYGELKRLADQGLLDKDSVKELWMHYESDKFEEDVRPLKFDQSLDDPKLPRPSYDKNHTVWEFHGPLPMKWVDLDMPEDTEEQKEKANEITPGKALVASGYWFLGSEEEPDQAMEPPILQVDYIRSGQTYGIGVCELMAGLQEELNEMTNQSIDNISLLMNKVIVAMEKYFVDINEIRSAPGAVWRVKENMNIDDVRKVVMEMQFSDVPSSSFKERFDRERQIQEVTAANRMTTGSAGMSNDTNQTLGGMELLRQAAFDRFTVYAYIIGRQFDVKVAKKTMELIYQNMEDETARLILGEQPIAMLNPETGMDDLIAKYALWKRMPPHELDICYDYVPADVFGSENKFQKSQDLMSWGQFIASTFPQWNPLPLVKKLGRLKDFSPEEITEMVGDLEGMMPTPMGMGQGVPSISKATKQATGEVSPPSESAIGAP